LPKNGNHLHQPVISMGARSYTFFSHFTWTEFWGRSPQPPEARGSEGEDPSAWRFGGIYSKNNLFLGMF